MFLYFLLGISAVSAVIFFFTRVKKRKKRKVNKREPLAIIGLACNFPKAKNKKEFWKMLLDGVDGVGEIPEGRWSKNSWFDSDVNRKAKMNANKGGYLDDIKKFDANFFNISPKEANRMDPQQRMLLEITYQTFEDAGIPLKSVNNKDVGVFLGIASHDYGDLQFQVSERINITGQTITGGSNSIAANRISYCFNLRGPSVAYDTACSSSIVALNAAMNSIYSGDASMGIVAGVSALIRPETTLSFSKGGSEGCGAILLKPLSQAIKDGDKIYSTIVISSLNQDGRTQGISMPSQEAQELLIKNCIRKSGINPAKIQYVEAHGTGTSVGDPIEAKALGKTFGKGRKETLYIGSVKSNIGHMEAGSAIGGLIKLALSMKNRKIPRNIHIDVPNSKIPFEKMKLAVPTKTLEWKGDEYGDLYAAVNSFGFGGTNGHAILRVSERLIRGSVKINTEEDGSAKLFFLSAKTSEALKDYSKSFVEFLSNGSSESSLNDICYTSMMKRSHFKHRLSIISKSKKDLQSNLTDFLNKEIHAAIISNKAIKETDQVAFIFSGQGPQFFNMGKELFETNNVYRKTLIKIDKMFQNYSNWSIVEEITTKSESESNINRTEYAQPSIFALQVALFEVYKSLGIYPSGHSIGEVAAGYASGQLTLDDAVKVIYYRSHIQQKAEHKGKMLATGLTLEKAKEIVSQEKYKNHVCIAANNGPSSVVFSGDTPQLEEISKELTKPADGGKEVFNRFLKVSVPFHSHHMEPLKGELISSLKGIKTKRNSLPLYSTVLGGFVIDTKFDENYWFKNVRSPVLFNNCIEEMVQDGYRVFLEISPHLILSRGIKNILKAKNMKGIVVHSLLRKKKDSLTLLNSISQLHCYGVNLNLKRISPKGNFVSLPTYPFQKKIFWLESPESVSNRIGKKIHPLIVKKTKLGDSFVFSVNLDVRNHTWLDDHRVQGPIIFPGAGFSELSLGCGLSLFPQFTIRNITFKKALYLPDDDYSPIIQFNMKENGHFDIVSKKKMDDPWEDHVEGVLNSIDPYVNEEVHKLKLSELKKRITKKLDVKRLYKFLFESGLMLGESFQGITNLWVEGSECLSLIEPCQKIISDYNEYNIHPTMLDACFQTLFGYETREDYIGVYVPVMIEEIKFFQKPSKKIWTYGRIISQSDRYMKGELFVFNGENDQIALHIKGFNIRYIDGTKANDIDISTCCFKFDWKIDYVLSGVVQSEKYLPKLSVVKPRLDEVVNEIKKRPVQNEYYNVYLPKADHLIIMYLVNCLCKFGLKFTKGEKFNIPELGKKFKVLKKFDRLFEQIFKTLRDYNYLDDNFVVIKEIDIGIIENHIKNLFKEHPTFQYELKLNVKCAESLYEVLIGETNPVELLFPQDDWKSIVDFYYKSFSFKKYSELIAQAIGKIFQEVPENQPIRILEVGAGTGGVTNFCLPILDKYSERIVYTFTDISEMFLSKAKIQFEKYTKFMKFDILDLENVNHDRFPKNSYDIIIASDVVHATQYIKKTVGAIKSLLGSGGMFIMLELTDPPIYTDYTFGLTAEWWHFKDSELRTDHPWLSTEKWHEVFKDLGFSESLSFTTEIIGEQKRQDVFVVRNSVSDLKKETTSSDRSWIIFKAKDVGDFLVGSLGKNNRCISVIRGEKFDEVGENCYAVNPKSLEDIEILFQKVPNIEGIVYLWGLDNLTNEQFNSESLEGSFVLSNLVVMNILKQIIKKKVSEYPKLFLVSANAFDISGDDVKINISQPPMWGLGRVLIHEHSTLHCCLIDISSSPNYSEKKLLLTEILRNKNDIEVGFRGNKRYVHKLLNQPIPKDVEELSTEVAKDDSFHVDIKKKGSLENIFLCKKLRKENLEEHEVEIKVHFSSLNFKDVMIATKLIHPDALKRGYTGDHFGMECSGVVTRVGSKVDNIVVGDEVLAIASDSLSTYCITLKELVFKKPKNLSFEQASTILFPYLTAYYSLVYVARIEKGEKVLIHSASGGVGIAAINICRKFGCEILATCGTNEKKEFLKSIGVDEDHIFNSRNLDFSHQILQRFGKINVVLNSIAGRNEIQKNIQILDDYGRFIELGKADIYKNTFVGLRPFGNNLSYFGVDIDKLITHKINICSKLCNVFLREIISSGNYVKYPIKEFPVENAKKAFYFMNSTKHIGKIVLNFDYKPKSFKIEPNMNQFDQISSNGTYLISAGTGGFCFSIAKYLIMLGAKYLVLFSRSGVRNDEIQKEINEYNKNGVNIAVYSVDVTNYKQMKEMFTDFNQKGFPKIRGVFHGAMVLKDVMLADMVFDDLMVPVRPKVLGAWILHELTLGLKLDFFIMFSSVASAYGTVGQGNYASSNALLDAFCFHRKKMGLNASTVNWGVIGEVGYVHRNDKVARLLNNQGWLPFSRRHVQKIIDHLLCVNPVHCIAIRGDWAKLSEFFITDKNTKRFGHLLLTEKEKKGSNLSSSSETFIFSKDFVENTEENQKLLIEKELIHQLCFVSGLKKEEFDKDESIMYYGFDSLMVNQMRNWIQLKFMMDYPMMKFMKGVSINALVEEIFCSVSKQVLLKMEKVEKRTSKK